MTTTETTDTDETRKILQLKLWKAAATGDTATVRLLAMHNVDLDAPNAEGYTAFNLAIQHNHVGTAKAILAGKEFQYLQKVGAAMGEQAGAGSVWKHVKA